MIQAKLIDEKTEIGTQLQNDNALYILDNVDAIINHTGEFDWSICNLLNVYKNLRIILISRKPIKLDNLEAVKHESMIKQMPPLTDEEAVDLIQHNCLRDIMDDLAIYNAENNLIPVKEQANKILRRQSIRPKLQ